MPQMNLDNRQARRMMDRMGVSMDQIDGVEEVIIRTADKDLVIKNASVSEVRMKGQARIFQVTGEDVEERMREKPKYTRRRTCCLLLNRPTSPRQKPNRH